MQLGSSQSWQRQVAERERSENAVEVSGTPGPVRVLWRRRRQQQQVPAPPSELQPAAAEVELEVWPASVAAAGLLAQLGPEVWHLVPQWEEVLDKTNDQLINVTY